MPCPLEDCTPEKQRSVIKFSVAESVKPSCMSLENVDKTVDVLKVTDQL